MKKQTDYTGELRAPLFSASMPQSTQNYLGFERGTQGVSMWKKPKATGAATLTIRTAVVE
jgi:hypothetical protein